MLYLSIRLHVILCRRLGSRNDLSSVNTSQSIVNTTDLTLKQIFDIPKDLCLNKMRSQGLVFSRVETDIEMYERSERPDETSWRATRETRTGFSHEETHHDGTAQSVVNEVTHRERSGRPDVAPQRGAMPQHIVIGNDETELELSVVVRIQIIREPGELSSGNKTNEFQMLQKMEKTFYDFGNVYGCNNGIGSIHRKKT